MKYKLLKDLPNYERGHIFEVNNFAILGKNCPGEYFVDLKDYPDWFEPIPKRIEIHLKESKYDILNGSGEYTFWINTELVPAYKKIDLMEKAINGELFTKEDLFSYTHKYMNMLPHNTNEDVFKEWIKNNK